MFLGNKVVQRKKVIFGLKRGSTVRKNKSFSDFDHFLEWKKQKEYVSFEFFNNLFDTFFLLSFLTSPDKRLGNNKK